MSLLTENTSESLALMTDFYQITMAYGFWKSGMEEKEGVFNLFFRRAPFEGGYVVSCGLENVIEYIENFHFLTSDLDYLSNLKGNDENPLFDTAFLDYLRNLKFSCSLNAIPEGTIAFPFEPIIRIEGPIIQCQLLETPLLNIINFQSLIATKAARVCRAAMGDPVLEFGARRAQGLDGALTASRAAFVGGCQATSNVLAGKKFGIPVKGTIAHSWIMAFESEIDAFDAYAEVMPNNCVLLADTYSTLNGVRKAIEIGKKLRERGFDLIGIRLDSGDLAYLSIESRKILDEAGFKNTTIVASNDLDENIIQSLKMQNAKIDVWGVGTKLITAYNQPALDGVYKLTAVRNPGEKWEYKIKVSEQSTKTTTPGIQQVRRYMEDKLYVADVIHDIGADLSDGCVLIDPFDITRQKQITGDLSFTELLIPIFAKGEKVYKTPGIRHIKEFVQKEMNRFHPTILRLDNPHQYPVGNEKSLNELKYNLILQTRRKQAGLI
jgi:nicotinate phosphoribosyltransferase